LVIRAFTSTVMTSATAPKGWTTVSGAQIQAEQFEHDRETEQKRAEEPGRPTSQGQQLTDMQSDPSSPRASGFDDRDTVLLESDRGSLRIPAQVRDTVQTGSVFVPFLYDGGAITALLTAQDGAAGLPTVRVSVPARAGASA